MSMMSNFMMSHFFLSLILSNNYIRLFSYIFSFFSSGFTRFLISIFLCITTFSSIRIIFSSFSYVCISGCGITLRFFCLIIRSFFSRWSIFIRISCRLAFVCKSCSVINRFGFFSSSFRFHFFFRFWCISNRLSIVCRNSNSIISR